MRFASFPHRLAFLPIVAGRPELMEATAQARHPSHANVDKAADQTWINSTADTTKGAGDVNTAEAGAMYATTGAVAATRSSRVPGPTVNRRVSVNSGAAGWEPQHCVLTCVS